MGSDGTGLERRDLGRRTIVVLYPQGMGYYVDRELVGLVPGYQTSFVIPSPGFSFSGGAPIQVLETTYLTLWPSRFGLTFMGTLIPDLRSILAKLDPDIVVTYELFSSLSALASRLKTSLGFRHAVLCYETGPPDQSCWGRFPVSRRLALETARRADLIVAHTQRAERSIFLLSRDKSRLKQVYPGVYPVGGALRRTSHQNHQSIRVGYLGRLSANKGIDTLLGAISLCNRTNTGPTIEFEIAGLGPSEHDVVVATQRWPNVQYRGWLTIAQKQQFLSSLDLLVYPSSEVRLIGLLRWEEQTATAAMEAMSQGVAIVGSTSGALPEIVGDAGTVFEMDSPSDLARALLDLAAHRDVIERLRASASQRAGDLFEIHGSGSRLGDAFSELYG